MAIFTILILPIHDRGVELVFGGGAVGLMGGVAGAALAV